MNLSLLIYRWITFLAWPFLVLYLQFRQWRGKEDAERMAERFGHASITRPNGKLVWLHAASVGEALSVLPLVSQLLERNPSLFVLVTTGTVTSAGLLRERLPARAFHQYVPIDYIPGIRRFLKHWQPQLALWVESELWPNLVHETHRYGCPMGLLNARLSARSMQSWKKAPRLMQSILSCFSLVLAQSEEDAARLTTLGANHVRCIGNLKYDAPPLPNNPPALGDLLARVGGRPVWLASSTHEGEEEIIASVHVALKKTHPNLLTIISPRHPKRGDAIARILKNNFGLAVSRRSLHEPMLDTTELYLADTLGELGLFYRLCGISFLGGSLVPVGGHNPLEAARLECVLITGPHTDNFTAIFAEMQQQGACLRAENAEALTRHVALLLTDHAARERYSNAALELVESKSGIVRATMEELAPFIGQGAAPC